MQVEQDHLHSIGNPTDLSNDRLCQDSTVAVYSKQDRGQYSNLPHTICHCKGRKGAPPLDLKALLRVPLNQEIQSLDLQYQVWEFTLQQQVKQISTFNHVECFTHVQQSTSNFRLRLWMHDLQNQDGGLKKPIDDMPPFPTHPVLIYF